MDSPRFLISNKDGLTPDILRSRGLNGSLLTLPSYLYLVITKSRFRSSAEHFSNPFSVFCRMIGESLNAMQCKYATI